MRFRIFVDPVYEINHGQGCKKSNSHSSIQVSNYVCSSRAQAQLKPNSKVIPVRIYTQLRVFETNNLGNLAKLSQSLQLIISYHMRSYSSFKVIRGSSLGYLEHWSKLGRLGPNIYLKSKWVIYRKSLKVFNSTFHAKWGLTRV